MNTLLCYYLWFLCIGFVSSGKVDGFEAWNLTELSHLEAFYGVSAAINNPLMVPLTLIQGAAAKGAGNFRFYFFCSFYY